MKILKAAAAFCLMAGMYLTTSAQTLFTYGNHPVSKDEFLKAYNNNPDTTGNQKQKMRDYLDLYINFRLKLQAAYDEKVNTNQQLQAEADNFKSQITDNYINQQADINQLLHEAFLRSQKDIYLQQVFVSFPSVYDTAAAYAQIKNALKDLQNGKSFDDVAARYSSNSAAKNNKGVIGYISVFSLPYSIENIVYSLNPGNYSAIYKSGSGYHIFKNVKERTALGRRKIQQLLFPTPSFFTQQQIDAVGKQADSVYNALQTGALFKDLLPAFGHDFDPYEPDKTIEISVGEYNKNFEDKVFNLKSPGDITKPFKTEYGYNIIKLVSAVPPSTDENDVMTQAYLQTAIQKDGRLDVAKDNLVEKWKKLTQFKQNKINKEDLWIYTDSALQNPNEPPSSYKSIKSSTVLFEFEKSNITVGDWIAQLEVTPHLSLNPDKSEYEKLFSDFIKNSIKRYYRDHIEEYSPSIASQLKEFNDANMLFYVMDKHVWTKASEDSVGLENYYKQHSNQYLWNKSVSALIVSGPDKSVVDDAAEKIKANPSNWRSIVKARGSLLFSDSNRYEADQLPIKQKVELQADFQTKTEVNDAGNSYSFVHVFKAFPPSTPRNFEDARGLVINDYQQMLEQQWIDKLKKQYPVKINETVLNSVLK